MEYFISQFTDERFDFLRIGNSYYLATKELSSLMGKLDKSVNRQALSCGLFMGLQKARFRPSLALIDLLAGVTDRKVIIDDKAAWLFLCGRDVFKDSVIESHVLAGLAIVCNTKGDVLGYGEIQKKGQMYLKNILDKGDYLRREMKKR